ncbi:hypothetical protein Tco_1523505 [Tanacetum coccineum]
MTNKLDDMIELPKSQPKKTYKEDLDYEMVMVKMPRCMSFLGSTNAYDEHIGSLGKMNNGVGNTSPQSTPLVLPSFEVYTPPMTYPEEVEETIGIRWREVPNNDEPEPQLLPKSPSLDETASQIQRDTVTTKTKTASQDLTIVTSVI